jgi:cytochrome c2
MIKRILVTAAAAALLAASVHAETAAMPTIQQNALVAKYCTVCHTGAHPPFAGTF